MSSEMVKKRGRPKKVIAELMEVEIPEVAKQTRAKSTKAAPKTVKAKASIPVEKPALKAAPAKSSIKAVGKPASVVTATTQNTPLPSSAKVNETKAQDTIINPPKPAIASPILAEVQKLKEQENMAAKPTNKSTQTKPSSSIPGPPPSTTKSVPPPPPPNKPSPPPPVSNPTPPRSLPIAALNSAIVSSISTRAGARPNTAGSKQLPQNYKSVSRKVTMAIVAMPVVIVTSYVLYQRLVLGEERKLLVQTPPPAVPVLPKGPESA